MAGAIESSRTHEACERCARMHREAVATMLRYHSLSWTSVDGPHGAAVWRQEIPPDELAESTDTT